MRTNFIIILLLHINTTFFAQTISKISYRIKVDSLFFKEVELVVKKEPSYFGLIQKTKDKERARFSLYFNKNMSLFELENQNELTFKFFGFSTKMFNFYINFLENKYLKHELGYLVNYGKEENHWQIMPNETKYIGKYKCKMAKTKYGKVEIIAWFAPEIPIPTGPGMYYGLPGLILEIINPGKHTIYASKISLNDASVKIMPSFPKGKEISLQNFEKIVSEMSVRPK